jgi:DNA polymerase
MNKQLALDQIKADIIKNDVCPDLAKTATNLVFGDGNPNADIVFIGEAPGRQEDEQGLPFVGASGKFLSDMLASVNMTREEVYITNIVKYRPPNNRDPDSEEKSEFLPYLVRQLQVIQPLVVVTLGRHSMTCFLPNAKISEIHGQPKRIKLGDTTLVILPLYHPAAALYNGSMRDVLMGDFSAIPEILKLIRKGK